MNKVIDPACLVKMKEFKDILIVDKNDTARRVFCESCSKSLVSRKNECLDHISSKFHEKARNNSKKHVDSYMKCDKVARSEIIFGHIIVMKNLSFKFADECC